MGSGPEQPTGTVTLVFTDIEGSTVLLRDLGVEAYRDVLVEHRRVVRAAFADHGGYEVGEEGDAFFFAFGSAPAAVAAVREATTRLTDGPVRVRVGVHTGEPLVDPPNYVGEDVHLAARIMSAGHGGQVLLSQTTRALVEGELRELGEHRLKDFPEAVALFQLGDGRFPPLRTISNTNLPRPASSFVGRERESGEVVSLVRGGARLVTLSGPGGSGKTRLALESGAELVPHFRDGVFWVALAAVRDSGLVVETVAQILGARASLARHVGEREMLLVLDNFEQVVDASPELTGLLRLCPNLSLLVTSRELLRIEGELVYTVPPLLERDAVALFCTRARVEPDSVIESLCRRLDCLPLAVEVAAARTAVLSPAQILDRISERLDLFRGRRDAEARQQTLRATIAWSYDLLPSEERRCFARLAVFAGGCTADGAEHVCDLELDRLQSLAEKSLIQYQGGRLTMLETVHEYARERLVDSGELVGIGRRHLEWVLALAEVAGPKLRGAEAFVPEAGVLELELDNIRAALRYALDHQSTDQALRLASSLLSFWTYSGRQDEGLRWLEEGLAQETATQGQVHADSTRAAGVLSDLAGLHDRAIALSSEAVGRYRALGDQMGEANALRDLGSGYALAEDWTRSFARLRESIALFERLDDPLGLARALNNLGNYELLAGSLDRAAELMTRALEIQTSLPIPGAGTATLHSLGMVALERGDIVTARELFASSLSDISLGGTDAAGNVRYITTYLGALAAVAALEHDSVRAGHLWGAVTSIEAERGVQIGADRAGYLKAMTRIAGRSFDTAMEAGRLLTLEEAVREALAPRDDAPVSRRFKP